ncbi:helix-turn-helix domain-containing protein [Lactovum odontotermitis]
MRLTKDIKQAPRRKRADNGWTRTQAAEIIGVERLTYGRLERDDYDKPVRDGTLVKITRYLANDYADI